MAERKWVEKTVDIGGDMWDKEAPLEGKLTKVEHNVGPNSSNIYSVEADGSETKLWGSTVLDDKLMGVPVGTFVKIEYNGKQTSKKGTQYHDYKVFIDEDSVPQEEAKSGYETARAQANALKNEPPLTDEDAPIELSDIPF